MLALRLTFDQSQIPAAGPATRHLLARITPPAAHAQRAPAPLDLAIVIDASGSMNGPPLEAVKEATLRLVRELPQTTRLTVVSFASDVVVHGDAMPLDEGNRAEITRRLARIGTRGSTDLHAGWQTACTLLAAAGGGGEGRRQHVVVLSDGHANQGLVDPAALAMKARSQREGGVSTSCVGIGDGYSLEQLAALAEHGGGACHDAENATEIVEVLCGEVLSLAEVVAEDVQLTLDFGPGVRARELSGLPASFDGSRMVVPIGGLRAGIERVVVVQVDVAGAGSLAAADGVLPVASGHLQWREPGSPARMQSNREDVFLQRVAGPIAAPSFVDARAVLVAWQACIVRRVTALNRDHDFAGLERLWRDEFEAFLGYARLRSDTADFERAIDSVRRRAMRPMGERSLKQAFDLATKEARQAPVYYAAEKGGVADQFRFKD